MHAQRQKTLSPEEYLNLETLASARHEYVDGEIYAMTGGSLRHNVVAGNIFAALKAHLRGTPCRVFMSDAKLHLARDNRYYYPDVMVSCEERLRTLTPEESVVAAPVLVVEVLSPATETIDRREKLSAYKKLESLKEYLLVDPDCCLAELYRRVEGGWEWLKYDQEEAVELSSVQFILPSSLLFEGLE